MSGISHLVESLIAYWADDPSLDEVTLKNCRDLAARLGSTLPPSDLRSLRSDPQGRQQEIRQLLESLLGPDPAGSPVLPALERPGMRPQGFEPAVSQTSTGDGNLLIGSGSFGGSLNMHAPGRTGASRPAATSGRDKEASKVTTRILFLGANPLDSTRLRLDEEVREIDQALAMADRGGCFELHQKWAVRAADLQIHLLRHRPHVLHFSGHGSQQKAIYLEGDGGGSCLVEATRLARLLSQFKTSLRCVVLNACYSEAQAMAIAEHIDCVVGMSSDVIDEAAIRFAAAFYQALAFGCSVKAAFDMACSDIKIGELGQDAVPQLLATRTAAEDIRFVDPP